MSSYNPTRCFRRWVNNWDVKTVHEHQCIGEYAHIGDHSCECGATIRNPDWGE